jgi:hypothetical protein
MIKRKKKIQKNQVNQDNQVNQGSDIYKDYHGEAIEIKQSRFRQCIKI